jgi:flagellar hook-length control protein FliK
MNTIPPVAPAPQPSDPSQSGAAASADSAQPSANSQNFAGALREAGSKPGHKPTAPKAASSHANGSDSPAVGNQLPPPQTPLPPATSPVAAPIQSDVKVVEGKAPAIAALKTQDSVPGAQSGPAATPAGVAGGTGLGSSPQPAPMLPGAAVNSSAVALSDAVPTAAASPAAASTAASTATQKIPAADTVGVTAAKSPSTAPGNGARDSEKTGPTGVATDGNASAVSQTTSAPPPTEDANSQVALAAAAAGVNAASPSDSSLTKDISATADAEAPANGALPIAPAGAATAATVAAISAKTAIAAVAATAASIAQLHLSDTRESTGVDKNSRDGAADLSLSGTSNDGSAGAAQLLSTVNSPAASTPQPILKVAAAVDSAEFGQGVADRVSLMVSSNLTSAKLQVNPPALGPIEVRIALQGGHAQVWLTSHSAVTRDALESSSPKLREMLGAQGFGQVSVDISQRSFQERTPQPQTYDAMPLADRVESISAAQPAGLTARTASGFLDAYA